MSRKNVLTPYHAIIDGDMSGDITSTPVNIMYLDNTGVQLTWTGSAIGSFFVDISNNYSPGNGPYNPVVNAGNWTALDLSPAPAASGSSSTLYLDFNQLSSAWIRIRYVASSSSGTLQTYVTAKSVGA